MDEEYARKKELMDWIVAGMAGRHYPKPEAPGTESHTTTPETKRETETTWKDKAALRAKYIMKHPLRGLIETLKDIHWGHSDNVLDMIPEHDPKFKEMYREAFNKDIGNALSPIKNFKESQARKKEMIDSLNNHRPSGWYYQGD